MNSIQWRAFILVKQLQFWLWRTWHRPPDIRRAIVAADVCGKVTAAGFLNRQYDGPGDYFVTHDMDGRRLWRNVPVKLV